MTDGRWEVGKTFAGKRLLFAGATGFVGKVALSMLLHRYGDVLGKVYVLARKGTSASVTQRFYDKIWPEEPFTPLRQALGESEALRFVQEKCEILDGDITDASLGLSDDTVSGLSGKVDIVINCAGLVSFNPSLELSLNVNTLGVQNLVELCLRWNVPLLHMSTAFVAGNRNGLVFEDEEIQGYYPKKDTLSGHDFSLAVELRDTAADIARIRASADDATRTSLFRQQAIERLQTEGRDKTDEKAMRLAMARERKFWLNKELVRAGMERAAHWGWPNTYTYTKSLGEQVIASTPGLKYAIVRPSIVESALRFPFPGWNEGFNTSAPLAFAGISNPGNLPAGDKTILDIIPVDQVTGALIAIAAKTLQKPDRRVYQLASGDVNPFWASRSVELVGLYRRRHLRKKASGNKFKNELLSRIEPTPSSKSKFFATSSPFFAKGAGLLKQALEAATPSWGAPTLGPLLSKAHEALDDVQSQAQSMSNLIDLFLPFLWENRYVFRCDNTRAIYADMAPEDAAKIPWAPEAIDWRQYFLEVHLPGLEKWVFPGIEEKASSRKALSAHRDLLEMFEASVNAHRHRVAFRMVEDDAETRLTFGDVQRFANRVGAFLRRVGVKPSSKVLLISENRPEWGISYFGILKAAGTVVPVDSTLKEDEVVNLAHRCQAHVCLISEKTAEALPGLYQALKNKGLSTQVYSLAQAMAKDGAEVQTEDETRATLRPDSEASIIFTSGTTGTPKGVVLTHRNFTSLVSKLAGTFELREGDGLLSVLPLHHTFEFSAGFLLPFSRGAEVTYIDELTADRLSEVFETGRITSMVGVPALWQLLHRKMTLELAAQPSFVEQGIKALLSAHGELRNRTDVNLGKLLFWPFHRKFGGNLKFMVSGGSALPDDVHKAFHALGFNLSEGYGLTEAAPVLTVAEAANKRKSGTVGRALPGVELKILNPDSDGVGEVLARGPNVMAGYYEDAEATSEVLKDGWLHTRDLGRIDAEGNLTLVGRQKDVIIDANGKNVYPDELEPLYADNALIEELSVVGLPDDAGGEKVACLCVLKGKLDNPDEAKKTVEEHFRKVSSQLPFYRRVKVLRFSSTPLPRTSTRKVQRPKVGDELRRIEKRVATADKLKSTDGNFSGLFALLSELSQKPASEIHSSATLAGDLGLDSLLLTELASSLELAGISAQTLEGLHAAETVRDIEKLLATSPKASTMSAPSEKKPDADFEIPEAVAKAGRNLLSLGQKALYSQVFDVQVTGKNFIPQNRNFLVIANHTSHLDMGLVKTALGEQGEKLTALAAKDYFFDTPLKRAYFENFTQLIPMERKGSLRESLKMAQEALHQGYHLLIFPEGTRNTSGTLQEFKPTLGYLALTCNVDVLPLYIDGAQTVLPKGALFPKGRHLHVRIGPLLKIDDLRPRVQGMPKSDGYRFVTRLCEEAMKALVQKKVFSPPSTSEDKMTPLSGAGET